MPSLRERESASFRTSVSASFASYSNRSFTGEYQGVAAKASYLHPHVVLELSLPYYRLVSNGLTQHGVGDLALDGRVPAYRSADGMLSMGPELALTLPTGDAARNLGMGHVMLMPGGFFELQARGLLLIAQVAYGRSAARLGGGAHHHGGYFPLVNPMNMQEIEHAVSVGYRLHPNFELEARALGAVPVNIPQGNARELVGGGVRVTLGLFDFGVEVQLPVVGAPFKAKTFLTAAAQW
ncbi:MAG: uncharacterized protein JWN48_4417 [Myxococcaceae bacterium]|nr:uncharacterized protein [Myxococcaceae bacterium]